MKWYQIYDYLQAGGNVRRTIWGEEEWVRLDDDSSLDNPIYLLDQDDKPYELWEDDFRATDWEYYDDEEEIQESELPYDKLLIRVKIKSVSLIQHFSRQIQLLMRDYAESHDCVATWGDDSSLKYYIAYSYVSNKYHIEQTWSIYNPTLVYFTKKEVAKEFINEYLHALEDIKAIEGIRGILFNSQNLTRENILEFNITIDMLSKKNYF